MSNRLWLLLRCQSKSFVVVVKRVPKSHYYEWLSRPFYMSGKGLDLARLGSKSPASKSSVGM